MYNQYGQQGNYGQQPMQQQRTGFQPQSSFGQQQGFGSPQPMQNGSNNYSAYGTNTGSQAMGMQSLPPQNTGFNTMQHQQPQSQVQNYAQQSYGLAQPPQQQQSSFMAPQQTGYNPSAAPYNHNSFSTYESQGGMNQMRPQSTGYMQGSNNVNNEQQNFSGYSGFNNAMTNSQPFQPIQSQQMPFVPSQSSALPAAAKPLKRQKTGANIPSTRLSFVQAADQQKFEGLFAKAVGPYNTALPGDEAKTILMKSGLPAAQLSKIWALSDTSRSGQLLFPEFVLAMHLCNDALRKGRVPDRLDERVKNEVSSMVDHISFTAADTTAAPSLQQTSTAPNFSVPQQQYQMSNVSLMAQQMQPAQMGFYAGQVLQPQATGYSQMQPQQTGYNQMTPQSSIFQVQPQQLGHNYIQPGLTGIQQPGITGVGSLQPQQTQQPNFETQFPMQSLVSQPTGRPGEWGFVHAPQGSVQGMQALGAAMMPGAAATYGNFQMPQQQKQVEVPWAITKEEKTIYDTIFQAWDKKRQGFVDGPVAIEVFGSSGVQRQDLELIWALADADDKGKLNADEFAVALHLIYRRLNGYEVPPVLPPELIPPSTRNFGDSISQVKSMLQQDASARSGPTSYMKNRSFKDGTANRDYSKDATVYKHNDSDVGYVSSSRRRAVGQASDSARASPVPETARHPAPHQEPTLSDLKKTIKEKQILLDAIDQRDEGRDGHDLDLGTHARRESDDLIRQVRKVQAKLDAHQNAHLLHADDEKEKIALQRRLQGLVDNLPVIASKVRNVEYKIQEVQYDLWSKQDRKDHPTSASIQGTGLGGQVTEADKRRAKTKAMMAARTAALTGKPAPKANDDDLEAASRRQADKSAELSKLRESNEQMIKDIEESAESLRADIESALSSSRAVTTSEHERRRWNDAVGVEPEVRDLIRDLNKYRSTTSTNRSTQAQQAIGQPAQQTQPQIASKTVATPTYNSFNAGEDRAAYLKQAAEARMAERLAALGIRPTKKSNRDGLMDNAQLVAAADSEARETVIKAEQDLQKQERLALESKTKMEEAALLEAQQKQDEELKRVAVEKQAGTINAADVSRQQKESMKPIDSRQAKLAQLRAEREARLAEEERLERELAADADSDSETEAPLQIKENNPFSRNTQSATTAKIVTDAAQVQAAVNVEQDHVKSIPSESNNPYHRPSETTAQAPVPAPSVFQTAPSPVARPPSAAPLVAQRTNAPRIIPVRKNSDDWSVASKEDDSSSDEEGPSPADLAARLFSGGIIPQRTGGTQTPISAQRTGATEPVSTATRSNTAAVPVPTIPMGIPPPPANIPPIPQNHAPAPPSSQAPPPPPPPVPSAGFPGHAPPPPPMAGLPPPPMGGPPAPPPPVMNGSSAPAGPQDRGALLASIKAGTGLKKVKTIEKGGVSGGRVL